MVKLNNEFSCERDSYGWTLIRYRLAKPDPKTGIASGKMTEHRTYHPNMVRVIDAVLDDTCSNLSGEEVYSLQDLKNHLTKVKDDIVAAFPKQFQPQKPMVVKLPKKPLSGVVKSGGVKRFPSFKQPKED